jgi:hypothetical protein
LDSMTPPQEHYESTQISGIPGNGMTALTGNSHYSVVSALRAKLLSRGWSS